LAFANPVRFLGRDDVSHRIVRGVATLAITASLSLTLANVAHAGIFGRSSNGGHDRHTNHGGSSSKVIPKLSFSKKDQQILYLTNVERRPGYFTEDPGVLIPQAWERMHDPSVSSIRGADGSYYRVDMGRMIGFRWNPETDKLEPTSSIAMLEGSGSGYPLKVGNKRYMVEVGIPEDAPEYQDEWEDEAPPPYLPPPNYDGPSASGS